MESMSFFKAGISVAVATYVVDAVAGIFTTGLYDPASGLWRAFGTPDWHAGNVEVHVAVAFLAVGAYAMCHRSLGKTSETTKKGLKFGILLWMVRCLAGSMMAYAFMPISLQLAFAWMGIGLISSLATGFIVGKLHR